MLYIKIKCYDIAFQNGKYGIIIEECKNLYFKDLYWISGVSYMGNVLETIQDDILKVSDESYLIFLLYIHPKLKYYICHNEELKHLVNQNGGN